MRQLSGGHKRRTLHGGGSVASPERERARARASERASERERESERESVRESERERATARQSHLVASCKSLFDIAARAMSVLANACMNAGRTNNTTNNTSFADTTVDTACS